MEAKKIQMEPEELIAGYMEAAETQCNAVTRLINDARDIRMVLTKSTSMLNEQISELSKTPGKQTEILKKELQLSVDKLLTSELANLRAHFSVASDMFSRSSEHNIKAVYAGTKDELFKTTESLKVSVESVKAEIEAIRQERHNAKASGFLWKWSFVIAVGFSAGLVSHSWIFPTPTTVYVQQQASNDLLVPVPVPSLDPDERKRASSIHSLTN